MILVIINRINIMYTFSIICRCAMHISSKLIAYATPIKLGTIPKDIIDKILYNFMCRCDTHTFLRKYLRAVYLEIILNSCDIVEKEGGREKEREREGEKKRERKRGRERDNQ